MIINSQYDKFVHNVQVYWMFFKCIVQGSVDFKFLVNVTCTHVYKYISITYILSFDNHYLKKTSFVLNINVLVLKLNFYL